MHKFQRVCVFCASSPGTDPEITDATIELGKLLVERDIELVYGGGAVGLMGLLDELAETLTWNQLGIMAKPVGVLNVNGFWTPLLDQFDKMVDRTILKPSNRQTLLAEDCPVALLDALANHSNSSDPKWIRA